jgi:exodeoxyribonuclease-3
MDFLMLTPDLAAQLSATGIDSAHRGREKPSDHAPVWVQL